jgi:hypothetical protein
MFFDELGAECTLHITFKLALKGHNRGFQIKREFKEVKFYFEKNACCAFSSAHIPEIHVPSAKFMSFFRNMCILQCTPKGGNAISSAHIPGIYTTTTYVHWPMHAPPLRYGRVAPSLKIIDNNYNT